MNVLTNDRGATAVEFGLVALPVFILILGIIQSAYILWVDNLLHYSVDLAARCGAIHSLIAPCNGTDMTTPAKQVFGFGTQGATYIANASCGGSGLVGTYTVKFLFVVDLALTAKSCYPNP